ncbi:alpha/beta fold hydrolase [Bacillus sp. 1NLA3E]|uniref:alpha/beta fold hydrolase n=1 Tax=Bacillus sp. 1NLA3E TaxID=666686 RepID=UPI000247F3FC|nr:alpha/beta hydrolase [Bacillus sp. 1NLA3E]AGK52082.1 putative 2-hydroxy-6-oxo-7-methylocta-2,4- dienoate hydrolase [Bacillus sp. 1NLA3E]
MDSNSKYLNVKGISTHYHESGQGETVLLIHGSGPGVTARANWRLIIPKLSENFRVFAPDIVGFGNTEKPDHIEYGVETWTEHLINFIEEIGQNRVHIIGNSLGGALALHIANKRPDLVGKMVLMGAAGVSFPITYGLDKVWGYQPSIENMKRLLEIFAYNQEFATDELAELRYKASIEPGLQETFSNMFAEPRQEKLDQLALPEEQIKQINHPVLMIHGRDDIVIPYKETSLRLLELLPNSELHIFSRCGHWTQIEKKDEFGQLCENFFLRK